MKDQKMRVLLDENTCDVSADTVSQAIAAAAALAEARGRMIVEVLVDGRAWTGEALDRLDDSVSADELRLTSADTKQLICDTFADAAVALTDAERLQQSAAELLQADRAQAAMEKLHEALSIWSSVQQAVTMGVELAEIDLDQAGVASADASSSAKPSGNAIDALNQQLQIVHQALESKDTVALADALMYQLPDVVRQWQGWLGQLQTHIRREDA